MLGLYILLSVLLYVSEWCSLSPRLYESNLAERNAQQDDQILIIVLIYPSFILFQVQLQNILMSKYVEYFQAEVSGWQRKLMVADLVISSWMSVQRTWAHLNSIFTNSHDIRCQLASDAERFQGIHTDLQVTHKSAFLCEPSQYISFSFFFNSSFTHPELDD